MQATSAGNLTATSKGGPELCPPSQAILTLQNHKIIGSCFKPRSLGVICYATLEYQTPSCARHPGLPDSRQHWSRPSRTPFTLCLLFALSRISHFTFEISTIVCCYCLVAKLCPAFAIPGTVALQVSLSMGFPDKITGVGCHFLLQEVFLTQGSNPCLLHWQAGSLPLSHQENPSNTVTSFKNPESPPCRPPPC